MYLDILFVSLLNAPRFLLPASFLLQVIANEQFICCLNFQDEARVAFWCLSRQQLQPDMLQQHCKAMVSAIALGLVTSNKWASMQCVHHSLKCIARMSQQVPEALREAAHLWLPQLWRLLLVQPVTQYEQVSS